MPQRISTEGATRADAYEKATRRAGVLLPCGFVARSSRSFGYAPHSTPRRKAKSLSARPMSTFEMSSNPLSNRPFPFSLDAGVYPPYWLGYAHPNTGPFF